MWKMKPSPKVLKATEEYVTSLGRKREDLTEEQWKLMVNYINTRRISSPILLIFCLVSVCMMFVSWHLGHKYITKVIPHHTITVSFNDQKKSIPLTPEEIGQYLNYITERYSTVGAHLVLAVVLLTFIILNVTVIKRTNGKNHRILLSRPAATESGD